MCRTEGQFFQVAEWIADTMAELGQDEFMATFASEYLVKQWCVVSQYVVSHRFRFIPHKYMCGNICEHICKCGTTYV